MSHYQLDAPEGTAHRVRRSASSPPLRQDTNLGQFYQPSVFTAWLPHLHVTVIADKQLSTPINTKTHPRA